MDRPFVAKRPESWLSDQHTVYIYSIRQIPENPHPQGSFSRPAESTLGSESGNSGLCFAMGRQGQLTTITAGGVLSTVWFARSFPKLNLT